MTVEQLRAELDAIQHPLKARDEQAIQRVFALYKELTQKEPRGTGCYGCALDAYEELRTIEHRGRGWDNSLNLPDELLNQFKNKEMESKLKKYKLIREFRLFGSPELCTAYNLTDAKVDKLLKDIPSLAKHFQVIEKPKEEKQKEEVGSITEPKQKTKKSKSETPKEIKE